MMKNYKIIILHDYKNRFGSKHFDYPYRSGLEKRKLVLYFKNKGFDVSFYNFADIEFAKKDFSNKIILYTSSEDKGYYYKSYIEDILFACKLGGALILPDYKYLRANNNKVFMEILRDFSDLDIIKNIKSKYFGTFEDASRNDYLKSSFYPKVVKLAEGASGENVEMALNYNDLLKVIKKMSKTKNLFEDLWDFGRSIKHNNYARTSLYRKKFIVQEFIPNLINDWKIYVFFDAYFIFYRPIFKKRKFKASGGGYDNYYYGLNAKIPDGIFDYAEKVLNEFNVPQISLDIAYDGKNFFLLEFQFLYFGTAGIPYSDDYFKKINNTWVPMRNHKDQELFYANSICDYLETVCNIKP